MTVNDIQWRVMLNWRENVLPRQLRQADLEIRAYGSVVHIISASLSIKNHTRNWLWKITAQLLYCMVIIEVNEYVIVVGTSLLGIPCRLYYLRRKKYNKKKIAGLINM